MEMARNDTPARQEPAGEEPVTARTTLATLSKSGRVKLRLGRIAFQEATRVVEVLVQEVGADVAKASHLTPEMAESWAGLTLVHDLWEYQMAEHEHRDPDLVTLTLSRCEALTLWKLWQYMPLPPHAAPAFATVMNDLQYLLG